MTTVTEDAPTATHLYTNNSAASQTVPILKPGTAKAGRLAFGGQTGERRMRAGDRLVVLAQLSPEACVATLEGDTRELLILNHHIRKLP